MDPINTPPVAQPNSEPAPGAGGQPVAQPPQPATPPADPNDPPKDPQDPPKDPPKPEGAPEKYEWELPEGVTLDQQLAEKFEPLAREMNLTNEQANKLAAELLPQIHQQMSDAWAQQVEGWKQTVTADPELGGANLQTTMDTAKQVMTAFGSEELTQALEETGFGNHPALVALFVKVGKAISEDKLLTGGEGGGGKKPFFANSNMN